MNTASAVREKQLNIRMSDEEVDRLEAVCQHYGLNGANLFRMLLRREATAIQREVAAHEAESPGPRPLPKSPRKR